MKKYNYISQLSDNCVHVFSHCSVHNTHKKDFILGMAAQFYFQMNEMMIQNGPPHEKKSCPRNSHFDGFHIPAHSLYFIM